MSYPNWFSMGAIKYFDLFLPRRFSGIENLNFLQIGAYTGDASEWLLDNILTHQSSWLTDVDTWCGSDEEPHKQFNWIELENCYNKRMEKYNNICKIKGYSSDFLQNASKDYYDFIYVDGDHRAEEVYKDAKFSWECLKKNGIIAFDDYLWNHESNNPDLSPKQGIDKFLIEYHGQYGIITIDEQVWIFKNE